MRRLGVALLGVPVVGLVYLEAVLRRSTAVRVTLALVFGAVVGLSVVILAQPSGTSARPQPSLVPLPPAAFTTVLQANLGLRDGVEIRFSRPMSRPAVEAALAVSPATVVHVAWRADGRAMTIRPMPAWEAGTFYRVSVDARATATDGQPLGEAARAAFVTRGPATIHVGLADGAAGARFGPPVGAGLDPLRPSILVETSRSTDVEALRSALTLTPALPLEVAVAGRPATGSRLGEAATAFVVRPIVALRPGTTYRLDADAGLSDVDGAAFAPTEALTIRTPSAPRVVRFRPLDGSRNVERDATLSIRFSEAMDPGVTAAAFSATANGTPVAFAGTRWAEGSTVLVATPATPLPAGAKVELIVAATARSADGVATGRAFGATFAVQPPPAKKAPTKKAAPKPTPPPAPKPPPPSTGSAGSATWYAVEKYYLRLMNCTRTGGWVTSTGSCSSPGGRNVAALTLSAGISSKVSRPYAKYLAVHNQCDHFIGGTPGDRLRRAGYTSYRWGENLGCRSGNPYSAVLGSHLYFQSEKSSNGGHYVNLMNALYDRAGIGVWVSAGRVRLVVDLYHP
ncbi:MAG TPA: Ig-like domain-containing protein [Candidatus Limnocylindrales bacterium]|nr:Ig-like domain-containing protein [Candidatus Limnocylindrales bacterium]